MNKAFLIAIGAILLLAQVAVRAEPAKKAPPLVLVANKYSYTFGTPDGWDHSFEQAREFGVPLTYFPKGGSFHESNTVIYINELCRANCTEALNTVIERILTNAKNNSPNLKVTTIEPTRIKEGGTAPIRILVGSRDPRQAKEALAFIEHKELVVLVVLTTKDTKSWENDFKAFQEIIGGHRFFNCDSPGLAVPCR